MKFLKPFLVVLLVMIPVTAFAEKASTIEELAANAVTGIITSKTTRNGLRNFILCLLVYGQLPGHGFKLTAV